MMFAPCVILSFHYSTELNLLKKTKARTCDSTDSRCILNADYKYDHQNAEFARWKFVYGEKFL